MKAGIGFCLVFPDVSWYSMIKYASTHVIFLIDISPCSDNVQNNHHLKEAGCKGKLLSTIF